MGNMVRSTPRLHGRLPESGFVHHDPVLYTILLSSFFGLLSLFSAYQLLFSFSAHLELLGFFSASQLLFGFFQLLSAYLL